MSLYNCKSDGDQYRISKLSNDLEVEASYLTSNEACDCPAGHRPVCRHRIMLPRFIAKNATAGQWFHNYEHQQWIRAASDDEPDTLGDLASAASELTVASSVSFPDDVSGDDLANAFAGLMHQPNDTKMLESIWQGCLGNEPKPINLLELARPDNMHNPVTQLGGFPYECFNANCTTPGDCIINGCAKGHGQPPRQSPEPKPSRRL